MLTQLLLLLGLCHQADVRDPKITTTLLCEYNRHSLIVYFYKDGNTQARIDDQDLMIPPENRGYFGPGCRRWDDPYFDTIAGAPGATGVTGATGK